MRPDVLRFLSCPACGASLAQRTGATTPEDADSELRCDARARDWPVRGGIPDLTFPDELREEDARVRTQWNQSARIYDDINRDFAAFETLEARAIREVIEETSPELIVALHEGPNDGFLVIATRSTPSRYAAAVASALQASGVALARHSITSALG